MGTVGAGFSRPVPLRDVRELPAPPRHYWRLVGPGIVAGGVGLSSGEFVLWPFIASQVEKVARRLRRADGTQIHRPRI